MKKKKSIGQIIKSPISINDLVQPLRVEVKLAWPIISQMSPPPYPVWKKLSTPSPHIQHHLNLHIGHSICIQPSNFSKGQKHLGQRLALVPWVTTFKFDHISVSYFTQLVPLWESYLQLTQITLLQRKQSTSDYKKFSYLTFIKLVQSGLGQWKRAPLDKATALFALIV